MGIKIKKALSISFIVIGVLFAVLPFINITRLINGSPIYNDPLEPENTLLSFPIIQRVHLDGSVIEYLSLSLEESVLNKYRFSISVYDENNHYYFNYDYRNYEPDIIKIPLEHITENGTDELILKIDCEDCDAMEFNLYESLASDDYVDGHNGKTLKLEKYSFSRNYGYFWHTALFITTGLVLLSMAKEGNEKKY